MDGRPFYEYDASTAASHYETEYQKMQARKMQAMQVLEAADAGSNAADFFEWAVDRYPSNLLVYSVDHPTRYTYTELDQASNQLAHWAIEGSRLPAGSVVCLLMENRAEYLMICMGLAKAGITVALLNTHLAGALLAHAVSGSGATLAIVSTRLQANWDSVRDGSVAGMDVWWYGGQGADGGGGDHADGCNRHWALDAAVLGTFSTDRVPRARRGGVRVRDAVYFIYTSGTTGPSKAARFSHKRWIGCALAWAGPSGLREGDRYYVALPLYHGNAGAVAVAPCVLLGNTVVLRERFSASSFFKDVRAHACVAAVYVGELWRYLCVQPRHPLEGTPEFSPLRVIIGNGLKADLWTQVMHRFGIKQVVEHYGSTEMPGDAIQNYFNKPGSCGYLPKSEAARKSDTGEGGVLVRYDVEQDVVVRGADNRCVVAGDGEIGEMIMRLPDGRYDGYVGEAHTRQKLYQDVFADGDLWWASGDLLTVDEQGFFYFVDRGGDSMRWKGENISSNEVGQVISAFLGVRECNVYGIKIPNTDGRAPMASIVLMDPSMQALFAFDAFTRHISTRLPAYSRPVFVRFRSEEHDKTSTLKFQKFKYAQQGYDVSKMDGDVVYMWIGGSKTPRGWVEVDKQVLSNVNAGVFRF
ncbi:hypothetical protein SeLEV6574_g04997 [Synchytrium endobioticum]|uniref:AMP-dependent synthetase/ligase domain-containing protein n=1 Tax=Synchytrium endobioticum TaxID=286115 RepID=A0A507CWD6_9FUNG|nr:hypothetical protein SeLEV6574_g04997 [Synchytrium endobioticum]